MTTMAQESSEFSDELDPRNFDSLDDDFDISENSFDYYFGLNASTDDSVGSTESAFSTPHTGSSLGDSSVPRSRHTQEILRQSHDHGHLQGHYGTLNNGDVPRAMEEGMSYNFGISYDTPGSFDMDNSPPDRHPVFQDHNYTFDQVQPTSSLRDHNVAEPEEVAYGIENSMVNEFSNQASWNANYPLVSMPQTSVYPFGDEAINQTQLFTSVTEDQNVPIRSNIASGTMHGIECPNLSPQEINSHDSQAPDASFKVLDAQSSSVGLAPFGPIPNAELYTNCPNATPLVHGASWALNLGTTSCYENSSSSMAQLMQTLNPSSSLAEMSEYRSSGTKVSNLVHSGLQRNLPVLQAASKSYQGTPHLANGLANLQPVFGPQEEQPRRSDRKRLTPQKRKKVQKVREKGSCIACALGKKPCDTGEICEPCQKMANNTDLAAEHICLRGILNFRAHIPDFFDTNKRHGGVSRKLYGPCRTIIIGDRLPSNGTDYVLFPQRVVLTVRVRDHETCDLHTTTVWSEGSMRSPVGSYAIDPSELPMGSKLVDWGKNILLEYFELRDFRPMFMDKFLCAHLDRFLFAYLDTTPPLPYYDLANLTIRLVSLSTWLYESHPVTFFDEVNDSSLRVFSMNDDDRIERRMSDVARSQLLLIAAKEFESIEKEILYKFDSEMRTLISKPQNSVILGLCLRRVALLYRDALKRYKRFPTTPKIIQKMEKPKAMYAALATAYSLVYSGARSPYSNKWKAKNYRGAFGNNRELSKLFVEVMKYDKNFCEGNVHDEDDLHLTKLFWKRKKGGGPQP